ncbi:MAG TPA: type II toxin-antitoxin system HigB family toxin [Amaricoccus sp.]|nr:type II toxin-antitoxin system HigB family toxin [Amaricoccus sp.]
MRIIAISTLNAFAAQHADAAKALEYWKRMVLRADWSNPYEVQADFSKARVLNDERVRFEVRDGYYRLVVSFDFRRKIAFVKFIGTHAEYDRIDALTVSMF